MRHTVKLQFPKFWAKDKNEPEVITEVDVKEVIEDVTSKPIPKPVLVGGALLAGLTIGYLIGHRAGVLKGGNTIIIR